MRGLHSGRMSERGSTIAFVAVSMVALLSVMALAIDLAMLYKARNEAQRAAEAASLAGASAFKDVVSGPAQLDSIQNRALRLVYANFVNGAPVDTTGATRATANNITTITTAEATVVVIPDTAKVRTYVRRDGIGTWFARIFGKSSMSVRAKAAAWASPATKVSKCVKPFAVPDVYFNPADDDQIWDPDEKWTFDPVKNHSVYKPFNPSDPSTNVPWAPGAGAGSAQTGFGSNFRNNTGLPRATADQGRKLVIKQSDPSKSLTAPFFFLWRYPDASGGADIRNEICGPKCGGPCSGASIGTSYRIEGGNKVGPTNQGVDALIGQDPTATWDASTNTVKNSSSADWADSPRVIVVGFFGPDQITGGTGPGNQEITFNNFGLLFLEGFEGQGAQAAVVARFIKYASGSEGGAGAGPLARVLQLVE